MANTELKKLTIEIDPVQGVTVTTHEGMIAQTKTIEMEDLLRIFADNVNVETGLMPLNTIFYSKGDQGYCLVIQVPAHKRVVKLRSRNSSTIEEFSVPIPTTIFGFVVRNGAIVYSQCASCKLPILTLDTALQQYPYGNVYGDLRICWGASQLPPIAESRFLGTVTEMFYDAPFNGDLFEGDVSIREYMETMSTYNTFPVSRLRSTRNHRTLNDFINNLKSQL